MSKKERAIASLQALRDKGIQFRTTDHIHYITTNCEDRWEFWPTTGTWINKVTRDRGKGIDAITLQTLNKNGPQIEKIELGDDAINSILLKVNINFNGRASAVCSEHFAITNAIDSDLRERIIKDFVAVVDRELKQLLAGLLLES